MQPCKNIFIASRGFCRLLDHPLPPFSFFLALTSLRQLLCGNQRWIFSSLQICVASAIFYNFLILWEIWPCIVHCLESFNLSSYDVIHEHPLYNFIIIMWIQTSTTPPFSSSFTSLIWSANITMWMVPFSQTQKRLGRWQH